MQQMTLSLTCTIFCSTFFFFSPSRWSDRYPASDASSPPPPSRWLRVLEHTHSTLAGLYEKNKQSNEAYEYYMKRLERYVTTPLLPNFNTQADSIERVNLRVGDVQESCFALWKLTTTHASLNITEMETNLQEALLAIKSDKYSNANLDVYWRRQLVTQCADVQIEAAYLGIAAAVDSDDWSTAVELASRVESSRLAVRSPCRVDFDVCRVQLPALLEKVRRYKARAA